MNWIKRNAVTLGVILVAIPLLVSSLFWVDKRYAYAEDVKRYQIENSQTLILIQLTNLEERKWRELKKPLSHQDTAYLFKLTKQIKKLEVRYEAALKNE